MAAKDYSKTKVINHFETKEMKFVYDKMADWYKKGLVRKDILSLQNLIQDQGKEDGYILWGHGLTGEEADLAASESKRYGFPIEVLAMEEFDRISRLQSATSVTIPRTAQNPERAMQLLELLHTSKGMDLYNLLVFGLEGEHYKKLSNDRIETIGYSGQGTADSKYGLWKWAVGNTFNANETQTDIEGYNKLVESVHEKAIVSSLIGFKPNTDDLQTELAQIRAVAKEFHNSLITGAVANHEKVYTEFMDKLEKAGSKKVEAELQKQVDAFLAKK
jgi:putative aldouronate transport system substrate-binding protein